jgi:integrase
MFLKKGKGCGIEDMICPPCLYIRGLAYNTFMLGGLPAELVRMFTGHSSEQMSQQYNHPILKQELKQTEQYQDQIDKIWE